MSSKKSVPPPAPDYSGLVMAQMQQNEVAKQQQVLQAEWAKDQAALSQEALKISQQQMDLARTEAQRAGERSDLAVREQQERARETSEITRSEQERARAQDAFAREQFDWAKDQAAKNSAITDRIVADAFARQDKLDAAAAEDRARYKAVFQPVEDQLVQEAQDYASPARMEQRAGGAMADVSHQFALARAAAQDRLEEFGIDPSQTRAGALDLGTRIEEAKGRASAGNMSREQTAATARALRSEAINLGRGYPGQSAQNYALAGGAGGLAGSTGFQNTQVGSATMGSPLQWGALSGTTTGIGLNAFNSGTAAFGAGNDAFNSATSAYGGANSAYGGASGSVGNAGAMLTGGSNILTSSNAGVNAALTGAGNLMKTSYDQLLDRYKAKTAADQQSSGWGSALGLIGGLGMSALTAPKTSALGGLLLGLAEGGTVPEEMSPSGGVAVDDVPAQGPTGAIQLDGGEFVVPADVVRWKGEEFFQKQITQSREKRKEAPARPEVRQALAIQSDPNFRAAVGMPPAPMHPQALPLG